MKCMDCGCDLTEKDYCTNCGADVRIYKRILKLSNHLYNDGLAKANVRDLSGAILSLQQSLRYNKNNMQARNLLGLVYYEMGETVSALSEWVISKNLFHEKNIADDYIRAIQSNQNRLETINQTIKKYNQALLYCQQGSEDLAIIQLKKVLSLNPNLVQGHQLMGLLYMRSGDLDKASKVLKKALKIDAANTTTMRYLLELEKQGAKEEIVDSKVKSKEDRIAYKSGNETIIQPTSFKESPSSFSAVINLIVGVIVGVALFWFLILPAKTQAIKADSKKQVVEYTTELSTKSAALDDLQSKLDAANSNLKTAQAEVEKYTGNEGLISNYENFVSALKAYVAKDSVGTTDKLNSVNVDNLSEDGKALYNSIKTGASQEAVSSLYNTGYAAYKALDYQTAITNFEQVVTLDTTNDRALYYLGKSYKNTGNKEKANECFNKLITDFPNSSMVEYAQSNIQ